MERQDLTGQEPNNTGGGRLSGVAAAALDRRVMPRREVLAPLLRVPRLRFPGRRDRLARALTVGDLRLMARRRVPRAVFDYTDGGANEEITLARNRDAFARVEFRPSAFQDVSKIDASTLILGEPSSLPLVFGPTGFTRLMHHEGELAVAHVADEIGIPYALSTAGSISIEELAGAFPHSSTQRWFQLYVWRDREQSGALVRQAQRLGYGALMVTVDSPVAGVRIRDLRNGMVIPPAPTFRTIIDGARRPSWWMNYLTRPPLRFATLESWQGTSSDFGLRFLNPSLDVDTLRWVRDTWDGKLIIKGISGVEDARTAVEIGAEAVVLSNHGGRQLDRAPVPLEQLPAVVDAIGDRAEVYVDSGIMSGADIVAAVCMGAKAALVGRAYLYGLMAGGIDGVRRCSEILSDEIFKTMQLLGATSVDQLTSDRARLRN